MLICWFLLEISVEVYVNKGNSYTIHELSFVIELGSNPNFKSECYTFVGVFTATIDQQQQKVTVTGSVGVEILLRKLIRAGKHAEIWPENLNLDDERIAGKGKKKKKKKKNEAREPQSLENKGAEKNATTTAKCSSVNKSSNNSPEKSPSGDHVPAEGGGSGKKKKKKVQSSLSSAAAESTGAPAHTGLQFEDLVGQVNVSPPRQQSLSFPETGYYPPMVNVAAYNRFYPSYYFYVPSSPYTCAGLDHDGHYQFQSPPLVSFEIFSDENANGCSVM